ncbi:MAG TPA: hypothetical protein VGD95_04515 [Micavibrio sp.]
MIGTTVQTNSLNKRSAESGNVIFFILLGILLLGLLTAALRSSGIESTSIDSETMTISVTRMKDQANALERGVAFIIQNGASDNEMRFSHPDADSDYGDINNSPRFQVFSREGGGVEYLAPPPGINDGTPWHFYGHTDAPQVGSNAADLIVVLPNITAQACGIINKQINQTGTMTDDGGNALSGGCVYGAPAMRFASSGQYSAPADNTMKEDDASFSSKPATSGCVTCADGSRHYFRVLLAR